MNEEALRLLNDVNRGIIKLRRLYAVWPGEYGLSYQEMLILYTIREYGFCTQKQICDNYLLPKQTIHNVFSVLRKEGVLLYDEAHSQGREKAFVLSDKGQRLTASFQESLDCVEHRALELMGKDRLQALTDLLAEYDQALNQALKETR